jgi:MFS family permease
MAQPQPLEPVAQEEPASDSYRRYVLGLLLVVYVFNFLDRQILTILLEPIKQEFALSDAQLGLLGGLAFAFFYTLLGIPIAMWADRGTRTKIIALALFIWSLMTAVTGLATSFATLLLARIGVGIGEAGGSPPSHSLLAAYFPPERRGMALGVYAAGIPIGSAIGALAGGWIGATLGWRTAFMVVGLPGVLLALVVLLTLRERGRQRGDYDGCARGLRRVDESTEDSHHHRLERRPTTDRFSAATAWVPWTPRSASRLWRARRTSRP